MANTFSQLRYHCIWSTKNRVPAIKEDIERKIWAILAETGKTHGLHITRVGGVENHVHVLLSVPKTMSIADAMKRIKSGSSNAINQSGLVGTDRFQWQDGYAAFTVSSSKIGEVVKYIANQRQHHRAQTFEEEFVEFLERHGVEYRPESLWG